MSRAPEPRNSTYRALLVRSGNQCAFPGCDHELVNHKHQFVAQVCHIAAASPGGERYDPLMTDEERRHYDNLLILCYAHHVETNDVDAFPPDSLRRIKRNHEASFDERYNPPDAVVGRLALEEQAYWDRVRLANEQHHLPEMRVPIDVSAEEQELIEEMRRLMAGLRTIDTKLTRSMQTLPEDVRRVLHAIGLDASKLDEVSPYDNPVQLRDYELLGYALPNTVTRLAVVIDQLEVRVLTRHVRERPEDQDAGRRLEELRTAFLRRAGQVSVID